MLRNNLQINVPFCCLVLTVQTSYNNESCYINIFVNKNQNNLSNILNLVSIVCIFQPFKLNTNCFGLFHTTKTVLKFTQKERKKSPDDNE